MPEWYRPVAARASVFPNSTIPAVLSESLTQCGAGDEDEEAALEGAPRHRHRQGRLLSSLFGGPPLSVSVRLPAKHAKSLQVFPQSGGALFRKNASLF